jgi:hypothetical protein
VGSTAAAVTAGAAAAAGPNGVAGLGGAPAAAPAQGGRHKSSCREVVRSGARQADMLHSHATFGCLCTCPDACRCERPVAWLQAVYIGAYACWLALLQWSTALLSCFG